MGLGSKAVREVSVLVQSFMQSVSWQNSDRGKKSFSVPLKRFVAGYFRNGAKVQSVEWTRGFCSRGELRLDECDFVLLKGQLLSWLLLAVSLEPYWPNMAKFQHDTDASDKVPY